MKVIAVIPTFNRLALLKECIDALKKQTFALHDIIVVANGSPEALINWLKQENITTIVLQKAIGSAGGFNEGIKEAYLRGADYIWTVDDDCVATPTALQELINAFNKLTEEDDEFGFLGSKAFWKDGSIHLMNVIKPHPNFHGKHSAEYYRQKGIQPSQYCTWVSMLISRKAVAAAGLPIKEFFFWHDDIEYTMRIERLGFKGGLVEKSVVVHKSDENYQNDIFKDKAQSAWKYRYGLRNQLYGRRFEKSHGSAIRNAIKRMIFWPFKILTKRKDGKWAYIKAVWGSAWESLWFDPPHEKV
jgi:GT2 family glycosyltransferase